jgi:thioredoxin 1
MSQKVMSLPTLALYENGQKMESILKEGMTESNIEAFIQKHI